MAVQHRQQDRQTVLFQAYRYATRIRHHRVIDQRLDLNQQRAGAFPYHHDRAAGGDFIAAAEEDGGGVAHFAQALLGHREDAEFVDRAKAVFMAAQRAETGIGIAVQQHRAVNTVFQYFRTGQRAIFGDVADHHNRHAASFGKARQIGRGFTYLGHAPRRRLDISHMHHLDGVDDHQLRLFFIGNLANLLDAGLREHIQIRRRQPETMRAHRYLLQGFFPGDVQRFHPFGQLTEGLQQQRRFPGAGVTADQNGAARHDAAAEYAVELFKSGGETRQRLQAYLR